MQFFQHSRRLNATSLLKNVSISFLVNCFFNCVNKALALFLHMFAPEVFQRTKKGVPVDTGEAAMGKPGYGALTLAFHLCLVTG